MVDTVKSMAKVAIVADEVLNLAKTNGLTLGEVLWLPDVIRNKVTNEVLQQNTPYKREKPQA